jgi:hypothetical protein
MVPDKSEARNPKFETIKKNSNVPMTKTNAAAMGDLEFWSLDM